MSGATTNALANGFVGIGYNMNPSLRPITPPDLSLQPVRQPTVVASTGNSKNSFQPMLDYQNYMASAAPIRQQALQQMNAQAQMPAPTAQASAYPTSPASVQSAIQPGGK